MRPYDIIISAVEGFYSDETGGSPEMIALFRSRLEEIPPYRVRARQELLESLGDSSFSWKQALWNEECHVEQFDTEDEARRFMERAVLPVVEDSFGAS